MRRLAVELFREVGVRPLENTREAAMVERFYCSRLYLSCLIRDGKLVSAKVYNESRKLSIH